MLQFRHIRGILAAVALSAGLVSCANEHFFPKTRPLFVGLDEARVPAAAKPSLAKAKEDFQRARHGQEPVHARYLETLPSSNSKVFQGDGYRVTLVSKNFVHCVQTGPDIVLESCLTGGRPCRYDELELVGE